MFHKLVAFIIVLIFSTSVVTTAEESRMSTNVIAEAIADVARDINRTSRPIVGYLLNHIGGNSRKKNISPIPVVRLIGKSPEYVETYTVNYQAQQTQTAAAEETVLLALIGIGVGMFCLWQINREADSCLSGCSFPELGGCNHFGYGF